MSWKIVVPVVEPKVRTLCVKPYPGHPKGCPNFGKKDGCPPAAPMLGTILDLERPVTAIWNCFDFGGHVERMRVKHPDWSERQLACCLYWQGTARKALRKGIKAFMGTAPYRLSMTVVHCPEACGVNVTATMASIGIDLEWPPVQSAYQVVLAGTPVEGT